MVELLLSVYNGRWFIKNLIIREMEGKDNKRGKSQVEITILWT